MTPFHMGHGIVTDVKKTLGFFGMPCGEVEIGCAFFETAMLDAAVTVNSTFFGEFPGRLLALLGA